MNMFQSVEEILTANFSEWIKVNDSKSQWTLEDVPYKSEVDDDLTKPHCWKCVTTNQCWFKNTELKKPECFDYSSYSFSQIGKSKRGLYHPNCHCKEMAINVPKNKDIKILKDIAKENYFFKEKKGWFSSWGYKSIDKNAFLSILYNLTIESYQKGNYEKEKHTKAGFQINIKVTIPGINEKKSKEYELKTCYIIFPNGKLRPITLVGGWRE